MYILSDIICLFWHCFGRGNVLMFSFACFPSLHSKQPLSAIFVAWHYDDVLMGAMASQITSLTIVNSTVYSDADQRKHQSSASLAFVWGIHRWPGNFPHKWPVTRKIFPFHDVIMKYQWWGSPYLPYQCYGFDHIVGSIFGIFSSRAVFSVARADTTAVHSNLTGNVALTNMD